VDRQMVRTLDPIVQHGIEELRAGVSIEHTLREVALMGAMVGKGASPAEAIRAVERREEALIGTEPQEAFERAFHPGLAAMFTMSAPMPYMMPGYSKMPMTKAMPMAKAYPMGWSGMGR
jgi:hypothetical protein